MPPSPDNTNNLSFNFGPDNTNNLSTSTQMDKQPTRVSPFAVLGFSNMAPTYTPLPVLAAGSAASLVASRNSELSFWWLPMGLGLTLILYWGAWHGFLLPLYFSKLRHIPTVPGCPLWGHIAPVIFEECGVPQRRWHRQYGPVIRYFFPLGFERLSLAGETAIKHLTAKNPYNFPKPVRAKLWMVRILGNGVLLAEHAEHVTQRKALTPGFSVSAVRSFTPIFWEKALQMTEMQLCEMEDSGSEVMPMEVLEWLNRCTLDIIGKAGFSFEIGSLENDGVPIRHAYRLVFNFELGSRILHGLQAFFPQSKHLPAQMNRDMEAARSIITEKATGILHEKLDSAERNPDAKDILSLIAQENLRIKAKGEAGLSFDTMRDQVMTFLGAGHDTTATGVAWTIHMLSIHPEMQDQLRDEIRKHMPFLFDPDWRYNAKELEEVDADALPYLDKVCRESLRFIPPIPMTVREAVNDDVIDTFHIPSGTVIYMFANAINRMEEFWGDDADDFDPERWDHLPSTAGPNAFMTFLQGPRGCLGRKFAEVEMKILVCVMLSRWEFERDYVSEDPEDWKMWRLVLRPRDGVTVMARPVEMCGA